MECRKWCKFGFPNNDCVAAIFIDLGIIRQQADADVGIWLHIKLSAQHIAIAVIAFGAGRAFQETIALAISPGQTDSSDILHNWNTDPALHIHEVVIAV